VKQFISNYAPHYENFRIEYKHGAVPTVFFKSIDNEVISTQDVSAMSEEDIDAFLVNHHIHRKVSHPKASNPVEL